MNVKAETRSALTFTRDTLNIASIIFSRVKVTSIVRKNYATVEIHLKRAVSRNSAKLGNYKVPVKLKET